MVLMDGVMQYGSPAYRAAGSHAAFWCADDGRTLLAVGGLCGVGRRPGPLEAIDVATGDPVVAVVATSGAEVAVVTAARRDVLTALGLPALHPVREIEVGERDCHDPAG